MNAPITRDLDEPMEIDPYRPPAAVATADNGSSVSSKVDIDNSTNSHLPYIWFNGVLAAFALGLSIGAVVIAYIKADTVSNKIDVVASGIDSRVTVIKDRATVSENHWRDIETAQGIMKSDLQKLEDRKHGTN